MRGLFLRGRVWWFEQMRDGRRTRVSLKTSDEAAAIVKARELRFEVESAPSGTFAQEIGSYLVHLRSKNRNGISLRYAGEITLLLKRVARETSCQFPADLRPNVFEKWIAQHVKGKVSEHTELTYRDRVSRFLRHLQLPHALLVSAPRPVLRKLFLKRDAINKILGVTRLSPELRFCLLCAAHAGLRKEEVIESRRDWFDLRSRTLHVKRSETWEPKDDEERVIPLTDTFVRFLRKFPKRKPHEYMLAPWKLEKGKWRYRYDFRRPFVGFMADQGLGHITFHDLRRSFASNLASSGESLYLISRWLGDDPRTTARTYAHIAPQTRGKIDSLG